MVRLIETIFIGWTLSPFILLGNCSLRMSFSQQNKKHGILSNVVLVEKESICIPVLHGVKPPHVPASKHVTTRATVLMEPASHSPIMI